LKFSSVAKCFENSLKASKGVNAVYQTRIAF